MYQIASLATEALPGLLVVGCITGMTGSVHGGLDERPAQVLGAVLGERSAAVAGA